MRFLEAKGELPKRIDEGHRIWKELQNGGDEAKEYDATGQDVVEQFIIGLGWRITATYEDPQTRSVLVTSMDSLGVKMVVTAKKDAAEGGENKEEFYAHFSGEKVDRFFQGHNGRAGVGVLGFELFDGRVEAVLENYKRLHPQLLVDGHIHEYEDVRTKMEGDSPVAKRIKMGSIKVLETYAYYLPVENEASERLPDKGTVLRFVERYGSYGRRPGFGNPQGMYLKGVRG